MTGSGRACGKVILFGEHFVLHGGTAIAVPLLAAELRVRVGFEAGGVRVFESPWEDPARATELLETALRELGLPPGRGLRVAVEGNLPAGMGLGSSAALCVALARSLLDLHGATPDEDLVSMAAFEMEHLFHGSPSGIDTTTVAFETPCFIKGGGEWAGADAPPVEGPVAGFVDVAPGLPLLVACSAQAGATRQAVERVSSLAREPSGERMLRRLTEVAESIALRGASALRAGAWDSAGDLLNENHYLLAALDLSTPEIEELRRAMILGGAWGAKLTGAGLGGSIAVLAPEALHDALEAEARAAGA
ncbi:MAG: mevalonate kinase, partial [Deltaproteobacteria bacterium]|nr:mevalonate kinase [Deltaproteobacteria bacterium]